MNPTLPPEPNRRSLICLSDRPLDSDALRFAEVISRALELQPVILHVKTPGARSEKTEMQFAAAQNIAGFENAELRPLEGNFRNEILNELDLHSYQLLILGMSERKTQSPVSPPNKRLAIRSKISALLIRNPPTKINRYLICTGGHEASLPAVSWGIKLAKTTGARATILHVASGPPAMYAGLPALEEGLPQVLSRDHPLAQNLKDAVSTAEAAGVEASLELRHGMVTEEILRACEMQPHDLVIIGAPKPRSLIETLLLGRVAPTLLASSHQSTLIVRGKSNRTTPK